MRMQKEVWMNRLGLWALLVLAGLQGMAQEMLLPLTYNHKLLHTPLRDGSREIGESRDTLCLPFFDDFSNLNAFHDSINLSCPDTVFNTDPSEVYPNHLFWDDSTAFVNATYPILPPTYGVVTLDGLRANGRPHNELVTNAPADTLTSKPIFLGGGLVDTVYLSFYYQPGGFGDFPESDDSLILEFRDEDGIWDRIWFARNTEGEVNQPFRQVMVPVADAQYLYDGFRFRFRNRANTKGNNDHWHLDYIYMDEDRSFNDTLFRDVSITSPPTPFLKRYRQMPWKQLRDHQDEEIGESHSIQLINNFNTIINTGYQYRAFETYTGDEVVAPTLPIVLNFDPFSTTLGSFDAFTIPPETPGYDDDSLSVTLEYTVDGAGDIQRLNDTIRQELDFYNYYAYDDGTAEKAYALNGTGAQLAVRFFAHEPDTLREVYIHWAYIDGDKSSLFFSLKVWSAIDTTLTSSSETVLYQADFLTPKYVDSINGFYVYQLTDFLGNPTPVVVDSFFYVGWLQSQADFLNVGFDKNSVANDNVFYNTGGNWQRSEIAGAIMIRPQVGGDYSVYTGQTEVDRETDWSIYPNPVGERIYFEGPVIGKQYRITDMTGRVVQTGQLTQAAIEAGAWAPGMYLLELRDLQNGYMRSTTFIKQ